MVTLLGEGSQPSDSVHGGVALTEDLKVVAFLTLRFLAGYEGTIPAPSLDNHASAKAPPPPCDIAQYITMELGQGAMLGPFGHTPLYTLVSN